MAKRQSRTKPKTNFIAGASAGGASPDELRGRVACLREAMAMAKAREKVDALLVTDFVNVRYLSGFTGDDSYLLVTKRSEYLLTDFRYIEEAELTVPHAKIIDRKKKGLMNRAAALAARARVEKLGVEASTDIASFKALQKESDEVKVKFKLKSSAGLIEKLRLIKSPGEIRRIEAALKVQQDAFKKIVRGLRPGMSEVSVAARLRYEMTRAGQAQDQAFSAIVAFGPRASLPHAQPTDAKLRGSDLVLIDWGARTDFYHSDLTRTFFVGRIPPRLRIIWQIVLAAQEAAIGRVKPGVKLAAVDRAARNVIKKAGYGQAFGHSTGHGLGLEIHEAPRLAQRSEGVAEPGMVFTIEPGIYLPGVGGVRIEDDVLVTQTGCRVLSTLEKNISIS